MAKYKAGDDILIQLRVVSIDESDNTYYCKYANGDAGWVREDRIIGLAADLPPQREPKVGDWVMVREYELKGKGKISEFSASRNAYLVIWPMKGYAWFGNNDFTPCDPPTEQEIIEMVLGKGS